MLRAQALLFRVVMVVAVAAALAGLPRPVAAGVEGDMSLGVDLPGGDFANFAVPDGDPGVCAQACRNDGRCTAWTFVKPGVQGAAAVCWLKSQTPAATASGCCISAVVRQAGGGGGDRAFQAPALNGAAVDWCATWATDCGQGGADLFCRTQGYARASQWNWAYANRTWVIGSSQFCESAGACGALRDVVCTASAGGGGAGLIAVTSATYGANCGVPAGNVTGALQAACNGRASCEYVVDYTVLGDPAPGCAKAFSVTWTCGAGAPRQAGAPGEAGFGSRVQLSCTP